MRVRTVKVTCVRMSEDDAFGRLGVVPRARPLRGLGHVGTSRFSILKVHEPSKCAHGPVQKTNRRMCDFEPYMGSAMRNYGFEGHFFFDKRERAAVVWRRFYYTHTTALRSARNGGKRIQEHAETTVKNK